jgi:hypothetical protein
MRCSHSPNATALALFHTIVKHLSLNESDVPILAVRLVKDEMSHLLQLDEKNVWRFVASTKEAYYNGRVE